MSKMLTVLADKANVGNLVHIGGGEWDVVLTPELEKFANLIIQECIDKIEHYQIPIGNSPAGEMACEWTYDALKEIRDEIKQHFGVK